MLSNVQTCREQKVEQSPQGKAVIDIGKDISRTQKPQAEREGKASFLKELTKFKC